MKLLPLLSLASLLLAASACTTDDDCEQLGACNAGKCECLSGWTGPSCGSLALAPAPAATAYQWPLPAAPNASSWGFSRVFDPTDGLYHALAAVACGRLGVIGDGGGDSFIVHLVSPTGLGGDWALAAKQPLWAPQTTFGPHVVRAPDGNFVAVFRVNVLLNATLCPGDGPAPDPAMAGDPAIPYASLVSGDPELGTSIYIAWAPAMAGPWSAVRTNITGMGALHKSNPSIFPLTSPAGKWGMAYRYNDHGERNAFAIADGFKGPWQWVANMTESPGNDEDPFLWQIPGQAGIAHIIYHNGPHGFHNWGSVEAGAAAWRSSPTNAFAFTLQASLTDGTQISFLRRERPELLLDARGSPTGLLNGVTVGAGAQEQARSFLQPVRQK